MEIRLASLLFFKQKTAYEITRLLEFRRVLFRSVGARRPPRRRPEAPGRAVDFRRVSPATRYQARTHARPRRRPRHRPRRASSGRLEQFPTVDRKSVV